MDYGQTISTHLDFDEAVARTRAALSEQGFGVLTEIDLAATMKEKLDEDIEPYVILGACNPRLANRALRADRRIGALLPCNVVVRADGDGSVVDALDPAVMSQLAPGLDDVADDARRRIDVALDKIADLA